MLQSLLIALAALLAAVLLYSNVSIPWQKWVNTCKQFIGGSLHQKPPVPATLISLSGKDNTDPIAELSRTATALADFHLGQIEPIPYRPFLSQGHYSIGKSLPKPSTEGLHIGFLPEDIGTNLMLIRSQENPQRRLDPNR